MKIHVRDYAGTAVAIMRNRVHDDGEHGVSFFSTVHDSRGMLRAVRSLIKLGVFRSVEAPRGEIAVSPGCKWHEVYPQKD